MKQPEYVCHDCDKIFTSESARLRPVDGSMVCPVCGSTDWEVLPDSITDFLEDFFHTPA